MREPPRSSAEPYFALQHRISAATTPAELDAIWSDAKRTLGPGDSNLGGIAEAISRVRRILEHEATHASDTRQYFALCRRIAEATTPAELEAIWQEARRTIAATDPNLGGIAERISRVRRILEHEGVEPAS